MAGNPEAAPGQTVHARNMFPHAHMMTQAPGPQVDPATASQDFLLRVMSSARVMTSSMPQDPRGRQNANARLYQNAEALMQVAEHMAQQYQKQPKGLTKSGKLRPLRQWRS